MDPDGDLNPDTDDLPLRANTNHILVRHYVLDLTVHFDSKVISGSIVLFLEPRSGVRTEAGGSQDGFTSKYKEVDALEDGKKELERTTTKVEKMCGDAESIQSSSLWHTTSGGEFTLVLDCCDLDVSKVEEVDLTSVAAMLSRFPEVPSKKSGDVSRKPQAAFIQNLISMPSSQWRQQHQLFSLCGRAPGAQDGSTLQFHRDRWSLQVRKNGVTSPQEFPCALRICYETKPAGGSVRWTKDQDNRVCVYTAGSPINNRALFPCQEPPVAMSTWQATVRAPSECVVLMSGEEQAVPAEDGDTHFLTWNYYVTMPMPASTFTLAVGEVRVMNSDEGLSVTDYSGMVDDGISCSHGDYPCRFTEQSAWSQRVIPHRVFSPACLLQKAQMGVLKLLPQCLAAAHAVLGVHPFPRLDVLIVPAGFSSLGMASPHIIFLSQSVLSAGSPGSEESLSLCGSRICHEISHSWFGLVIGARDWTEEWISEGFATCLEDIIWAQAQQLSLEEKTEQFDLKALLRWRRLSDELQNSKEELQILRPNMEKTGQVSESGSSTVKHALNPEKPFMQVHYLKGYFLLRFLASQVGEQQFIEFFQLFVKKYHGHLILSQVRLETYLCCYFRGSQLELFWLIACLNSLATSRKIYLSKWRMQKKPNYNKMCLGVSRSSKSLLCTIFCLGLQVRHRWCELVVKHAYAQAYGDVEHFLIHDQAMGVYLYGELMVQEDPEQQALARHCLSLVQGEMDQSACRVVEEMVL
uniref:Aminopeptidase O (putative) n=1 Tax=Neolamprologus brichardi TaxID=32507 RepID=A0A3Q4HBK1_NEOBR